MMKLEKETNITLTMNDYTIIIKDKEKIESEFKALDGGINYILATEKIKSGFLIYDLSHFPGYMFLDKRNNFYDTTKKRIYFNNGKTFIGDNDKNAFSLFDNFDTIEKKIKEANEEMRKVSDKEQKKQHANNAYENLKKEIQEFNFDKIKLINGKYGYLDNGDGNKEIKFKNGEYEYLHEKKMESFVNNKKIGEYEFYQEIKDNEISLIKNGKGKEGKENDDIYEVEYFYNEKIGREKKDGKDKKFYFFQNGCLKGYLNEIKQEGNITIYEIKDKRIILLNNNSNNFSRILIKDIENKKIIYEIYLKIIQEKIEGMGIVHDFRNREILIVDFDTNNIISNNLGELKRFIDREEFEVNKRISQKKEPKFVLRNIIDEILTSEDKIELLAQKINEIMIEEKRKILGIKDQKMSGECWLFALSELIVLTNSRIYGRKSQSFDEIKNHIVKLYSRKGKNKEQINKIMNDEFIKKKYGLIFEKEEDENKIKKSIKYGIKYLFGFFLKNKEWANFCDYFNDKSIEPELKVLTKEILQRPNKRKFKEGVNPEETAGHAVVLIDIDKEDNYILVNSWGKDWGNEGIFKVKKGCLGSDNIYSLYFTEEQLSEDEIKSWDKLKKDIKVLLLEMRKEEKDIKEGKDDSKKYDEIFIKCPKCNHSAPIKGYESTSLNQFTCPFEERCKFEIKDGISFMAEQLYYNDKKKVAYGENKFDFDYLNFEKK